jgi:hypothetical protein
MPISLAKLVADRASVTLDFGDDATLNIDYHPTKVTGKMLQDLAALDDLKNMSHGQAIGLLASATNTLLALLAAWDLVDDDGAVLPLDQETVESLGLTLQWRILAEVIVAGVGGGQGKAGAPKTSSGASGAGSLRKGSTQRR